MNEYEREWLYTVAASEELPAEVLAQLYPDAVLYGPNYEAVLAYADAMAILISHGYPLWLRKDLINLQTAGINVINTNLILNRQKFLMFDDKGKGSSEWNASQAAIKIQTSLQDLVKNRIHATPESMQDYQNSYLNNIIVSVFYIASVKGAHKFNEIEGLRDLSGKWEESVKETLNMVVTLTR